MSNHIHNFDTALNEDANWASFLYLTNELSVEESEIFEDQLAEREDLQQALIDTTRQLACLSASQQLLPTTAAPLREVASQPPSLKAVAVIASLVACVAVAVLTSQEPAGPGAAGLESVVESDVDGSESDVLEAWVNISSADVIEEDDEVGLVSDLSVPDWMLTAVLLEAEDLEAGGESSYPGHQPSKNSDSI